MLEPLDTGRAPIANSPPPPPSLPFRYAERAPSAAIAPWVLTLWSFQADAAPGPDEPYTVWPDGCTSVVLLRLPQAPDSILSVGPRQTAIHPPVNAGQRLWGVRLWPDALAAVTGIEAPALRDQLGLAPPAIVARFGVMASEIPRADDLDVVFPVMDRLLTRLLHGAQQPDPRVRTALRLIVEARGVMAMADIARGAAIGLRHLQRLFPASTGLTLREFARIRRLRTALAHRIEAHQPGWSRIAAETGFVDHAHLTREFRALTGLSPSHAAQQLSRTAHENVIP